MKRQLSGGLGALCLACVAACLMPVAVAEDPASERSDRLKAAFVLNIARFVSWPPEAFESHRERLLLCLYRTDPFGGAIETIHGKEVAGRRLEITRVSTLFESDDCNILLIAPYQLDRFKLDLPDGFSRPLLTIADLTTDDGTLPRGGVLVSLVRHGTRIGFEIDLGRSREVGLRMSSKLLKLATIVGD